ncbi:hypothetical protein CEXT_259841 [Caerostris extrusa]|uniref:Uncharacterized protein n=1 Tax=Caerostris extrusa TaxID=172846 RepID=A0AAV4SDJ9_CAEEX|nr:hypothetical protein CEXT_259841 [Caerostris extrusa]
MWREETRFVKDIFFNKDEKNTVNSSELRNEKQDSATNIRNEVFQFVCLLQAQRRAIEKDVESKSRKKNTFQPNKNKDLLQIKRMVMQR